MIILIIIETNITRMKTICELCYCIFMLKLKVIFLKVYINELYALFGCTLNTPKYQIVKIKLNLLICHHF